MAKVTTPTLLVTNLPDGSSGVEPSLRGVLREIADDFHLEVSLITAAGELAFCTADPSLPPPGLETIPESLLAPQEPKWFLEESTGVVWLFAPWKHRKEKLILLARYRPADQPPVDEHRPYTLAAAPGLLRLFCKAFDAALTMRSQEADLVELSDRLLESYEEISVLYRLGQQLRLDMPPEEVLSNTCQAVRRVLGPQRSVGCLIRWPEARPEGAPSESHSEGELALDSAVLERLLAWYIHRGLPWGQPFVDNHFEHGVTLGLPPATCRLLLTPLCFQSEILGLFASVADTDAEPFDSRDAQLMANVATQTAAHWKSYLLFTELRTLLFSVVRALVSAIDAKDPYTCGHSERVAFVSRRLAEGLGMESQETEEIYLSALLHDIGKIGIRGDVLRKPGRLTPEEWEHLKTHPEVGARILEPMVAAAKMIPGVRYHHEAMNGKGYPLGLVGAQIPLIARIIAVADAFDAMASSRPYREALPLPQICDEFRKGADQQWDGAVVNLLLALVQDDEFLRQYKTQESRGPRLS